MGEIHLRCCVCKIHICACTSTVATAQDPTVLIQPRANIRGFRRF
jgi:hypothetical protein